MMCCIPLLRREHPAELIEDDPSPRPIRLKQFQPTIQLDPTFHHVPRSTLETNEVSINAGAVITKPRDKQTGRSRSDSFETIDLNSDPSFEVFEQVGSRYEKELLPTPASSSAVSSSSQPESHNFVDTPYYSFADIAMPRTRWESQTTFQHYAFRNPFGDLEGDKADFESTPLASSHSGSSLIPTRSTTLATLPLDPLSGGSSPQNARHSTIDFSRPRPIASNSTGISSGSSHLSPQELNSASIGQHEPTNVEHDYSIQAQKASEEDAGLEPEQVAHEEVCAYDHNAVGNATARTIALVTSVTAPGPRLVFFGPHQAYTQRAIEYQQSMSNLSLTLPFSSS